MKNKTIKKAKHKAVHRHKWEGGYDFCWDCGAYEMHCIREDCYATKYCTGDGKCAIEQ